MLTLVLGGIRAPRTARNPSEKSEPFGQEAYDYATRRYMQRDVEFEIDSIDKSGGFIGTLWVNKSENAAISLVKEGLASVHDYSAETLPWAGQLYAAQVRTLIMVILYTVSTLTTPISQSEAQKSKTGVRMFPIVKQDTADYVFRCGLTMMKLPKKTQLKSRRYLLTLLRRPSTSTSSSVTYALVKNLRSRFKSSTPKVNPILLLVLFQPDTKL